MRSKFKGKYLEIEPIGKSRYTFNESLKLKDRIIYSLAQKLWILLLNFNLNCNIYSGITHLKFKSSGNHYTWRKVKTVVHNIVIGKLWIDNCGEMEIVNHKVSGNFSFS